MRRRSEKKNFSFKFTRSRLGVMKRIFPSRDIDSLQKKSTYEDLSRRIVGEDLEVVDVLYSSEEMYLVLRLDDNTSL